MDNNKTENRDLELTELTKLEDKAPVAHSADDGHNHGHEQEESGWR